MGSKLVQVKKRQEHINKVYVAELVNNACPHCGLNSLVRDGKGSHCLQCGRDFGITGRRFVSEKRELKRGCYPNGNSKGSNGNRVGAGANSGNRLGRS